MSSKKLLNKPKNKVPTVIGLGFGFASEFAVAAWLGWQVGKYWQLNQGGSYRSPGLFAAGAVLVALLHVCWLLWRISTKDKDSTPKNQRGS